MGSTLKEKQPAKAKKTKPAPEITIPKEPEQPSGYFEVKRDQDNQIKEIYLEVHYTPADKSIPITLKLGARQTLKNSDAFDEQVNKLWARLLTKIDEIRPE